eukprot:TRINITY_DN4551_c0_g1_i1.p1 TRINITY_DN4551_c0_g1~~TRINITY_DN4551_c0_g1_i1.p1  ORF type:complete len:231 (-),score=74.13 TRINITY_DN4551_c0_g1_i1:39-731(-)
MFARRAVSSSGAFAKQVVSRRLHQAQALSFKPEQLEPALPRTLIASHYEHYYGQLTRLNNLVDGTPLALQSLDDCLESTNEYRETALENRLAAECWAHAKYFHGLTHEESRRKVSDDLAAQFDVHFDGADQLGKLLEHHAHALFGSGWVFVVLRDGQLEIVTSEAGESLSQSIGAPNVKPIFALDAWEHAYYPAFGDNVGDYVRAWWKCQDMTLAEELLMPELRSAGLAD